MIVYVDPEVATASDVITYFAVHKHKALKRHGMSPKESVDRFKERVWHAMRTPAEKCAALCKVNGFDPCMVVEACFAYANSMRHNQGPQPNMLGSVSYVTKALAYHLEVPYEVVGHKFSKENILASSEKAFNVARDKVMRTLKDRGKKFTEVGEVMISMASLDPLHAVAIAPMDMVIISEYGAEVIDEIESRRASAIFAESRGITVRMLAKLIQHSRKI